MDKVNEKRKHEREIFYNPICYVTDYKKDGKINDFMSVRNGIITNISRGGLSFDCIERIFEKGSELLLGYVVGKNHRKDEVSVVYIINLDGSWRCGCRFLKSDEERDNQISHFLKERRNI